MAASALVAQRTCPGPSAPSADIGAAESGVAGRAAAAGCGAGVVVGGGSARAAKRTMGARETNIDLRSGDARKTGRGVREIPLGSGENVVPRDGSEPPTQGFSVPCSTN